MKSKLTLLLLILFISCEKSLEDSFKSQELIYKGEVEFYSYRINEDIGKNKKLHYDLSIFKNLDGAKVFRYFLSDDTYREYIWNQKDEIKEKYFIKGKLEATTKLVYLDKFLLDNDNETIVISKYGRSCYSCSLTNYLGTYYFSPEIGLIKTLDNNYFFSDQLITDQRITSNDIKNLFINLEQNRSFYPDENQKNQERKKQLQESLNFMELDTHEIEEEIEFTQEFFDTFDK
ncbi:hypothetical protein [Flammeovirga pacifica]|uniref:Lipoprotein n=1 Tax=Flammeovirga pacifica TaxID=915059 RepID=A0A1S1Z500_FLAPC|nr:hypothetical protein [Flammeovirga pacifica]OHX68366.1 hypothetical protein NH26_19435 [Flammeovirga pacifica]